MGHFFLVVVVLACSPLDLGVSVQFQIENVEKKRVPLILF
jgi:hypothetical protein